MNFGVQIWTYDHVLIALKKAGTSHIIRFFFVDFLLVVWYFL
ncbi:hypothetical protein E9O_09499 [Moraxella catarrhalis 12P80B1]|nr:hypothetical protein E9G_01388 [Moraxella catarrhalis 7169]EGE13387.1 hypothetical protein E9O_09499 [Moraxella catarrhalis 12P80B1]EGE19126.1 hypothetical protein E9Q_03493 [Moraxella catarrhalis BC1]